MIQGFNGQRGWFTEGLTPHEYHCRHIRKILKTLRTPYQNCVLADTYSFGRCLILDGETQSSSYDEFIYHEALIHPALLLHPNPKEMFILGGGEGASLREALKHKTARRVVMADIDSQVLDLCRERLPEMHQGSFEDSRVRVLVEDAQNVLCRSQLRFDVIVSDLPSALRAGPAYSLYTRNFYRKLKKRLGPGGIFALQAGSGHPLQLNFHKTLVHTLCSVFRLVRPYYAYIPAYNVPWAFLICTDGATQDPRKMTAQRVNALLKRRGVRDLRFLDGETFEGLFRIPRHLRMELARGKHAGTIKEP